MGKSKPIITADLRKLEKQLEKGEISYSRMVEMLNENIAEWLSAEINEAFKSLHPSAHYYVERGKLEAWIPDWQKENFKQSILNKMKSP